MVKSSWLKTPRDITPYIGFVYLITDKKTKLKYIGIKKFKTKKGRETNWRTYKSSGASLKGLDVNNKKLYKKEILKCCKTITIMKCYEAYLQLKYYHEGRWNELLNECINIRLRIRK